MKIVAAIALGLLGFPYPLRAAPPAASPTPVAPGAAATVALLEASGPAAVASGRLLQNGDRVQAGDRIEAPVGQAVRLTLPDGSEVTIARGAKVTVGNLVEGGAGAKSAEFTLEQGIVHISAKPGYTRERPFLLRTPTAVLGVRGTQFVVEQAPGGANSPPASTLYTLEGAVAMARSDAALNSGRGAVVVGKGRTSTVDATMQMPRKPSRINRKTFFEHFDRQAPEVGRQIQRAREARRTQSGGKPRSSHKPLTPPHPKRRQLKKHS